MDINTNIRSKKKKKERYAITNVSLMDISKIIKSFEKFPYEGYVRNRSKHEPTDSYFYLAIYHAKCIMRLNLHVVPVRTQIINTRKMNKSDMSMQRLLISLSDLWVRANQKGSKRTRENRISVLRTIANKKELSSMNVIWTKANQRSFI